MEKKQFDIPSVLRILETICKQFPDDTQKCQEEAQRRFKKIGLDVDLEETMRQHAQHCFHDDAEIILVADDGMRFTRFRGSWIVGTDETMYLVFRVMDDYIENVKADGSVERLNG